jgi:hypothetical protein
MNEHRLNCTETTLKSKCPHVIADDENIVIAFPDLFPTGKFGYTHNREVHLTHTKYFNQRLLDYTQKFASDQIIFFFLLTLYPNKSICKIK